MIGYKRYQCRQESSDELVLEFFTQGVPSLCFRTPGGLEVYLSRQQGKEIVEDILQWLEETRP